MPKSVSVSYFLCVAKYLPDMQHDVYNLETAIIFLKVCVVGHVPQSSVWI